MAVRGIDGRVVPWLCVLSLAVVSMLCCFSSMRPTPKLSARSQASRCSMCRALCRMWPMCLAYSLLTAMGAKRAEANCCKLLVCGCSAAGKGSNLWPFVFEESLFLKESLVTMACGASWAHAYTGCGGMCVVGGL